MNINKIRERIIIYAVVLLFGLFICSGSKSVYAEPAWNYSEEIVQDETEGQEYLPEENHLDETEQLFENYLETVSELRDAQPKIRRTAANHSVVYCSVCGKELSREIIL